MINAATALSSAVVGAGAVLLAQRNQWKRDAEAAEADQLKRAVEEVLVKAQSVAMRSNEFTLLSTSIGSPSGQFVRVIGSVTPLDIAALFDAMNADIEAMQRAAARIWMESDQEAVTLTNAVVIAAAEVIDAHQTPLPGNRVLNFCRGLVTGTPSGDPSQVKEAREALGRARKALVEHTRRTLKLEHVDLFALPGDPS
jgi:hypothetical protein